MPVQKNRFWLIHWRTSRTAPAVRNPSHRDRLHHHSELPVSRTYSSPAKFDVPKLCDDFQISLSGVLRPRTDGIETRRLSVTFLCQIDSRFAWLARLIRLDSVPPCLQLFTDLLDEFSGNGTSTPHTLFHSVAKVKVVRIRRSSGPLNSSQKIVVVN